ncbi:ribose-5-phosphate isomerase [Candidatus Pacearchaeota archaeon]|nr:ribose-5-phosphate isomerase [Candidatus Pacearchaeota archaeon]
MKIYIGADHAGVKLKEKIVSYLKKQKIAFEDFGSFDGKSKDDYPDFAVKVGEGVSKHKGESLGILICGSGTGMAIAANKVKGIRAATGYDAYSVKKGREDNDVNVLCLRGREMSDLKNLGLLKLFLKTGFSKKSRHLRRIHKISRFEGRK